MVLPKLVGAGIAALGMKHIGSGKIVESKTVSAVECLEYALNLPTSVVITGCESMERLHQAVAVVRNHRPMAPAKLAALLSKTKGAAKDGRFETFKTTTEYDGTSINPHWMK